MERNHKDLAAIWLPRELKKRIDALCEEVGITAPLLTINLFSAIFNGDISVDSTNLPGRRILQFILQAGLPIDSIKATIRDKDGNIINTSPLDKKFIL